MSFITLLTIAPHRVKKGAGFVDAGAASKVITRKPDGSLDVQGYGNAKYYAAEVLPVHDFDGLVAILRDMEQCPHSFVVRGIPKPGVNCDYMRRNIHDKLLNKDTGEMERAEMQPDPNGLQWIMVDLDDLPNPLGGLPPKDEADTIALAQAVIKAYLPWYFQDRRCYFQFSSSQGINGGWQKIRLHLWFWLNRPIPDKVLHDVWADKINRDYKKIKPDVKKLIDPAVYVSTQPNYTAAPTLIGFENPPVVCRSGIVPGGESEVVIPEAELVKMDTKRFHVPKDENPLAEKYSGDWLMIEKAINAIRSDCDYEKEFVPIGIALYNASSGGSMGLNLWQSLARRRDAVRPRDYHKPAHLERKWAGLYGYTLPAKAIFSIAKRYGFELPKPERFVEMPDGRKRKKTADEIRNDKARAIPKPTAPEEPGETAEANPDAEPTEAKPAKPAAPIRIPPGYMFDGSKLYQLVTTEFKNGDSADTPYEIFPGELMIRAVEVDASSGEYCLRIAFNTLNGAEKTVTAPQSVLATRQGVVRKLAAAGAAVSEEKGAKVAEYLMQFLQFNRDALPHLGYTNHLGLVGKTGLVAPGGSVNTGVEYRGPYKGVVGSDWEGLKACLREAATWEGAWPLWLDFGASLASPIFGRLRMAGELRRNPVLVMFGESGSGKSTGRYFVQSMWGDPETTPFRFEATNATAKSYTGASVSLGSLPFHVDEIHTAKEPEALQSFIYAHANGATSPRGTTNGGYTGGVPIFGTAFFTGEHMPKIDFSGAANRMLIINADNDPPLGVPGKIDHPDHRGLRIINPEGKRRAKRLERTWLLSGGILGPRVYEYIMDQWEDFRSQYKLLAKEPEYKGLEQWADITAVIMVVLQHAFDFLDIPLPAAAGDIPAKIQEVVDSYRRGENDPVAESWNNLLGLLGSCQRTAGPDGRSLFVNPRSAEVMAWTQTTYTSSQEEVVCVSTVTEAFRRAIPNHKHVLRLWVKRGLIWGLGKKKNEPNQSRPHPVNKVSTRCIIVSMAQVEGRESPIE